MNVNKVRSFFINLPDAQVTRCRVYWWEDLPKSHWLNPNKFSALRTRMEAVRGSLYRITWPDEPEKTQGFLLFEVGMNLGIRDRLYIVQLGSRKVASEEELSESEKARKTLADIHSIATALESYAVDWNRYPKASSLPELANVLQPTYIKTLPLRDAWNRPLLVTCNGENYEIRSLGSDGKAESSYAGGAVKDLRADIIFANGQFVQWPEGAQLQ